MIKIKKKANYLNQQCNKFLINPLSNKKKLGLHHKQSATCLKCKKQLTMVSSSKSNSNIGIKRQLDMCVVV